MGGDGGATEADEDEDVAAALPLVFRRCPPAVVVVADDEGSTTTGGGLLLGPRGMDDGGTPGYLLLLLLLLMLMGEATALECLSGDAGAALRSCSCSFLTGEVTGESRAPGPRFRSSASINRCIDPTTPRPCVSLPIARSSSSGDAAAVSACHVSPVYVFSLLPHHAAAASDAERLPSSNTRPRRSGCAVGGFLLSQGGARRRIKTLDAVGV